MVAPATSSLIPQFIDSSYAMKPDTTNVHVSKAALTTWVGDDYSKMLLDQIAVMVEKEDAFFSCVDYIGEMPMSDDNLIDEEWRQKAAEWMFRVIDFYDLDRDIVSKS